ncbi:MAG: hypothetical protein JW938_07980 [Candidatus Omnitrophica bacterium]|nr:hypothetical protein [Candidatus Omnitrophota bacterium]
MTLKVILQGFCVVLFIHGIYFYAFKRAEFCGKKAGRCDTKTEVNKARMIYFISALFWTAVFVLIQIYM